MSKASYYSMRLKDDNAFAVYEALVQRFPDKYWGRRNLSGTYVRLSRQSEAVPYFVQWAELQPTELWPNYVAAKTLTIWGGNPAAFEKQDNLAEAIRVLERGSEEKQDPIDKLDNIDHGPFRLRIRFRLAKLYRKLGRVEDAQRIECDLLKQLSCADVKHPILRQLKGY